MLSNNTHIPVKIRTGFQTGLDLYSVLSPSKIFQNKKVRRTLPNKLEIMSCNRGLEKIEPVNFLITTVQAIPAKTKSNASLPLPTAFRLYANRMHPNKGDKIIVHTAIAFFE